MTTTVSIRIIDVKLDTPTARELIGELNVELARQYPEEGANHFRLDPDEVAPGRGAFLVAEDTESGRAFGCGAIRVLTPDTAELKRMYVRPVARGRGVGSRLLRALEERAVALGVERLVLETGTRQVPALGLYYGAGYAEIERFGEYADSPLSMCLAKPLVPAGVTG